MTNLETKRLILRNWKSEDKDSLYELAKDHEIGPRCGWLPHKDVNESLNIICNVFDENTYAIVLIDTNQIIGCISLMFKDKANLSILEDETELGYWIGRPYWNQGYVSEAAKTLIRYGFESLHLSKIWCLNFSDNLASARVKEKLGFKHEYMIPNKFVSALNVYKEDRVALLTRAMWEKL